MTARAILSEQDAEKGGLGTMCGRSTYIVPVAILPNSRCTEGWFLLAFGLSTLAALLDCLPGLGYPITLQIVARGGYADLYAADSLMYKV